MIFGVRTNFTLTNESAWIKVNAFNSCFSSLIIIVLYIITLVTFKKWNSYLIGLAILSIIPTIIYHELLRHKIKQRK